MANTGSALNHATMALTEVTDNNQSQSVWFPSGITACLVLKDPATLFKEFYWWALSYPGNNCQVVGAWIGTPTTLATCADGYYTDQTGISC